jgi:hypothetical protein
MSKKRRHQWRVLDRGGVLDRGERENASLIRRKKHPFMLLLTSFTRRYLKYLPGW